MKKSSPHEKGAHITSDVIMSWFRTFIVKSWISQTQYLVPANVLGLLLLWVTKISLLASGLLHKVRNLLSPLPNVLCLTAAADNESFFFFLVFVGWSEILPSFGLLRLETTLHLRSATINTVTAVAVVYFEVSRLSDELKLPCCMAADDNIMKKRNETFYFTQGSEVRDCLLITSSVESRTKTSSASPLALRSAFKSLFLLNF